MGIWVSWWRVGVFGFGYTGSLEERFGVFRLG